MPPPKMANQAALPKPLTVDWSAPPSPRTTNATAATSPATPASATRAQACRTVAGEGTVTRKACCRSSSYGTEANSAQSGHAQDLTDPPSHQMVIGWSGMAGAAYGGSGQEREDHHQRRPCRPRPD